VRKLSTSGLATRQEVPVSLKFEGVTIDTAYRADLIVEDRVLVELKAVQQVTSIHEAQLMTYMRLSRLHVGLLINFNVYRLKSGIHRFIHR
jgi:GxxExxY protein